MSNHDTQESDTYVMPEDGYDICESCNYLEPVFTTIDHADTIVPLCQSCDADMKVSN